MGRLFVFYTLAVGSIFHLIKLLPHLAPRERQDDGGCPKTTKAFYFLFLTSLANC